MTDQTVRIPASRLMRHVTVHVDVDGARVLRVRLWIGSVLLRAAAAVMGCNLTFESRR